VALHGGNSVTPQALVSYLSQRLPEYMAPSAIVLLSDLPLTPNGKIDRRALPLWKAERLRGNREFQAPATATELRLAEVWREVVNIWPIGATDNFFELGSDSLQATQLLAVIEERFRVVLPSAVLWRFPTLRGMASALESREPLAGLHEEVGEVVPLQPRGSRLPLFCFPGNDGAAFFLPLATCLGDQQPFYAIRDPRPFAERGQYTVEEAAHRMVDAIRKVQSTGPYVLGGHCFGGLLAFEAARRLTALGETVATVILVDVSAPGDPKVARHWKNYFRLAVRVLRGERGLTWAECREHAGLLTQLIRRRLGDLIHHQAGGPPVGDAQGPVHPNVLAGRRYHPKPFACDLVNIIAAGENHSTEILSDPRLAWKDLAQGSFAFREIPGRAEAIYRQPGVRDLAARIAEVLDAVNARFPPADSRSPVGAPDEGTGPPSRES